MSIAPSAVSSVTVGAARSATAGTSTVLMLPSAGVLGMFVAMIQPSTGSGDWLCPPVGVGACPPAGRLGRSRRYLGGRGYRDGGYCLGFTCSTAPRASRIESSWTSNSCRVDLSRTRMNRAAIEGPPQGETGDVEWRARRTVCTGKKETRRDTPPEPPSPRRDGRNDRYRDDVDAPTTRTRAAELP